MRSLKRANTRLPGACNPRGAKESGIYLPNAGHSLIALNALLCWEMAIFEVLDTFVILLDQSANRIDSD